MFRRTVVTIGVLIGLAAGGSAALRDHHVERARSAPTSSSSSVPPAPRIIEPTLRAHAERTAARQWVLAVYLSTVATSTTTTVPAEPVPEEEPQDPASSAQRRQKATEPVSGQCGGTLPPCYVLKRESGGDARVWTGGCYLPIGYTGLNPCNRRSTASGLWQITRSTWAGFDGYVNAADAPVDVQNARAAELWDGGNGCGHWSAC